MMDDMESPRFVTVATVRDRIQASLLANELARHGIQAEIEEATEPGRLRSRLSIVRVAAPREEEAREVVANLTGRSLSMPSPRRLIPAILFLVALVAVIAWLVDLIV